MRSQLKQCPDCATHVMPMRDGTCPSCRKQTFEPREVEPNDKDQIEIQKEKRATTPSGTSRVAPEEPLGSPPEATASGESSDAQHEKSPEDELAVVEERLTLLEQDRRGAILGRQLGGFFCLLGSFGAIAVGFMAIGGMGEAGLVIFAVGFLVGFGLFSTAIRVSARGFYLPVSTELEELRKCRDELRDTLGIRTFAQKAKVVGDITCGIVFLVATISLVVLLLWLWLFGEG